MPWTSRIDRRTRVIYTRVTGTLSVDEARRHRALVRADPGFDETYRQVLDLRAVADIRLKTEDVKALAAEGTLTAAGDLAIVTSDDALFGLCRMYYAYASDRRPQRIDVCRTIVAACERLGIPTFVLEQSDT
jgi:hypothetical protein